MANRWVVNASPLILLAKVGQIKLLSMLAQEVVIPQMVVSEILAGPIDDPARIWLSNEINMPIVPIGEIPPALSAWDLGAGETAVMTYALANPGWIAILDDNAARKCARSFAIPVKGTLAVVILGKQQGVIPSAAGLIRQLQEHNYRIQDHIVREALAQTVNEKW